MFAADPERVLFCGHPSWRSMLSFHVRGLLAAIVAGVAAGLISAATAGHVQAGWVLAAVLVVFALTLFAALIRSRRITYTVTDRRLSIETGLVARDVHETRLEQIQNVSISQSLLDRLLDVGTIAFDTAGGASFEFAFRGVTEPRRITRTIDQALHERSLDRA